LVEGWRARARSDYLFHLPSRFRYWRRAFRQEDWEEMMGRYMEAVEKQGWEWDTLDKVHDVPLTEDQRRWKMAFMTKDRELRRKQVEQ